MSWKVIISYLGLNYEWITNKLQVNYEWMMSG
jgi:hypothetical protein